MYVQHLCIQWLNTIPFQIQLTYKSGCVGAAFFQRLSSLRILHVSYSVQRDHRTSLSLCKHDQNPHHVSLNLKCCEGTFLTIKCRPKEVT